MAVRQARQALQIRPATTGRAGATLTVEGEQLAGAGVPDQTPAACLCHERQR
ncbi:hypothetical protein OG967_47460 [Streptomyces phaeochromogenes]|nr:hypothetical protein [Streptomyces phaeochromogenes]